MAFLVLVVAAWKYVGWYAGVGVIVLAILFVRWQIRRAVKRLMLLPFRMKGGVLKGAHVEVHRVEKVSRPNAGFDPDSRVRAETVQTPQGMLPAGQEVFDSREDAPRAGADPIPVSGGEDATRIYWRVEVTIRPQSAPQAGPQITRWEPAQMVLVPFNTKTDMNTVRKIEGIMPVRVEVLENEGWIADARGAYEGPARVRYTFPLKISNQETRWKLRYYFEGIGDIKLA
jgi:hypothetical protein